jgi:hypothetical protein
MTYDRMYHSAALLLPDGRVLTAGGENSGRLNAQIFSPPYLFKGQRPTINSQPGVAAYGTNFSIAVGTDGSSISQVALIRPAAVTHAFDHNQRYVPLTFSQVGNNLTVAAPPTANHAPPGYYMLVATDSKGVPSIASWVRVDSLANLTPGTLTGTVTDRASGAPVPGASVSYSGGSTTTDAAGSYTLTDVLPGEKLVTVSASGYATVHKSREVIGGQTATLDIPLDPPGTITGRVTNSDTGDPIEGATILFDGGSTTTNGSGDYTIDGIASGSQSLIASANGYNSSPAQVINVPANGSADADIALTPKPSYIAGEVRDAFTDETIAGATVTANGVTVTADSLGRYQIFVPPGTYSVAASKDGYISSAHLGVLVTFGTYTAVDLELNPTNPPVSFAPIADAHTYTATPLTNFGTAKSLTLVSQSTGSYSAYLRFNVAGLTRAVQSAKVRLYVTSSSDQGGAIHSVANTYLGTATPWTETGINASNAPAIDGTPLSSIGAAPKDTWVEFDVTAALNGNGLYNFGLRTASSNDVRYNSREASGNRPELVIQQADDPLPEIAGFSPPSGLPGSEVIILGAGFAGITSVRFGGVAASSFTVDTDTQIRAVVPLGAASGKVSLTVAGGWSISEDDFVLLAPPPPPVLDAFSPASGPVGTEVTIKGAGLGGATSVTFNGAPASSFTIDSATQLRAIVPAGATSGAIRVTTAAGSATSAKSFVVSTTTPVSPLKRTFVPLSTNGVAVHQRAVYSAQSIGWSDQVSGLPYLCEFGGR